MPAQGERGVTQLSTAIGALSRFLTTTIGGLRCLPGAGTIASHRSNLVPPFAAPIAAAGLGCAHERCLRDARHFVSLSHAQPVSLRQTRCVDGMRRERLHSVQAEEACRSAVVDPRCSQCCVGVGVKLRFLRSRRRRRRMRVVL